MCLPDVSFSCRNASHACVHCFSTIQSIYYFLIIDALLADLQNTSLQRSTAKSQANNNDFPPPPPGISMSPPDSFNTPNPPPPTPSNEFPSDASLNLSFDDVPIYYEIEPCSSSNSSSSRNSRSEKYQSKVMEIDDLLQDLNVSRSLNCEQDSGMYFF